MTRILRIPAGIAGNRPAWFPLELSRHCARMMTWFAARLAVFPAGIMMADRRKAGLGIESLEEGK